MKKLLLLLILFFVSNTYSQTGVLKDKNGQIMRGTPMVVGKAYETTSVAFAKDVNNWKTIRDTYKVNTIRLCWVDPWFKDEGQANWGVFEALFHIDKIVANANATGMNVIINYHNTGEQIRKGKDLSKNQDLRIQFWRNIAKKYKDNDLVYFELSNEPVFDHRDYINSTFKNNLLAVYDIVRFEAPNRQIILFSFNNISGFMDDVVNNYGNRIDWTKASVGYHAYHGDWHETTSKRITDLAKIRRVICTEFDNKNALSYVKQIDGFTYNSEALERINQSWIDWRGWGDNTLNELDLHKSDAQAKGYWWGGGSTTPPGGSGGNVVSMRKGNSTGFAIDGNFGGANSQNVYIWGHGANNVNQQWVEINRGGGYYSYKKNNTNFCLDGGNGGANGQNVYLWSCSDNNQNQHWKKVSVGSGKFRLEKRNASGFSIDGGNGGSNGQNLYLWSSNNGNQNQHWLFGNAKSTVTPDNEELLTNGISIGPNPIGLGEAFNLNIHSKSTSKIQISITDITGRVIYNEEKNKQKGLQKFTFSANNLSMKTAGLYFIRVTLDNKNYFKKLLVK